MHVVSCCACMNGSVAVDVGALVHLSNIRPGRTNGPDLCRWEWSRGVRAAAAGCRRRQGGQELRACVGPPHLRFVDGRPLVYICLRMNCVSITLMSVFLVCSIIFIFEGVGEFES